MNRIFVFLTLVLPLFTSAQNHDGNYQLQMTFRNPNAAQTARFEKIGNNLIIENNIPTITFEFRTFDPKTEENVYGIIKGIGSGVFTGDHMTIKGSATFNTFDKDKNDMHIDAVFIMEGDFTKLNSSQNISGTFTITREETPLFDGNFIAISEKGHSFKLVSGKSKILFANGREYVSQKVGEEVAITYKDKICTDENTLGEIVFEDGSIFKLKSNSTLLLIKGGIQLQFGEAWLNLPKQGSEFSVVTPTAICSVLGTEFIIKVNKESTLIHLLKGKLSVSDKIGNKVTLEAGQAIKATIVGLGTVVGFDENEVIHEFKGDGNGNAGNSLTSLLNGNAMLVGAGLLIGVLFILVLIFVIRKSAKRTKTKQFTPVPDYREHIPAPPSNAFQQASQENVSLGIQPPKVQPLSFCSECGSQLVPDARFCNICGTKV